MRSASESKTSQLREGRLKRLPLSPNPRYPNVQLPKEKHITTTHKTHYNQNTKKTYTKKVTKLAF